MITIACIVCGEDVEISIDELLEMEDDEILCPECSTQAFIYCTTYNIKPN